VKTLKIKTFSLSFTFDANSSFSKPFEQFIENPARKNWDKPKPGKSFFI